MPGDKPRNLAKSVTIEQGILHQKKKRGAFL